jgi:sulfonate transport system ATP-binding protein
MSSVKPIVRIENVTRTFTSDKRTIYPLKDISLQIHPGEFVALVGKSGSGKTTLLRLLAGIDSPNSGILTVAGTRTVVFQEPRLVQSMKVWQNVALGLPRGASSRDAAHEALTAVGLDGFAMKWPATLSGGEAQRVALARALIRKPHLLLLDEPFGALDALTRLQMQSLVGRLCSQFKPATLIVTHDVDEAILLADRVLVLRDGEFSLEVTIGIQHPRPFGGPIFSEIRRKLLRELGVETESGSHEEIVK